MSQPLPGPDLLQTSDSADIALVVGENLHRMRVRQGLSLERLAKASGVSRAMLGQIELGRSAPTIGLLWKVARALDVPLTAFLSKSGRGDIEILRAHRSKWLTTGNGRFSIRLLTPMEAQKREELREIRISSQSIEEEEGHASGTIEQILVIRGILELRINNEWHRLEKGDTAVIAADTPHAYRNPGLEETHAVMVMIHPISSF